MTIAATRFTRNILKPSYDASCKAYITSAQPVGSGVALDQSSNGKVLTPSAGLSDANMWANAGYVSSLVGAAAAQNEFTWADGVFDWNKANGDSFLLKFIFKSNDITASGRRWVGNLGSVSPGFPGICLSQAPTSGLISFRVSDGTNGVLSSSSAINYFNNADHTLILIYNARSGFMTLYVDSETSILSNDLATITGSTLATGGRLFGFGNSDTLGAALGTVGVKFSNIELHLFKNAWLPKSITRVIAQALANPRKPINWNLS